MNWFSQWLWNRQRKAAIKADQKSSFQVVDKSPKKLFHIALSVTYKNVPMTKVNITIAHYSTSAEQAKKEIKQFAALKTSGIKEVKPLKNG
jgi:hypothetical protein